MANYSIAYDITADTSGFTKSLNDLSSKAKNFFSSIKGGMKDFTSGLGSMGSEFKKFGKDGSAAFKEVADEITDVSSMLSSTGLMAGGIIELTSLLQKLGDEFDNLKARMVQLTGAEGIGSLENSLKDVLGSGVAQDAGTIAETLAVVNRSFKLTGDSLEILTKKFADFAHVTGADIPESVGKVSEAVKKWGLDSKDVSGILEKLTYASQNTNTSVSELLTGLTNGQAILSQFGMSVTESIAFLSKLSDNGIKVNTTLWGMRQALSEFSKSGVNASKGLAEVTEQIQNAKTQTEALNIAVDVFGTKAGAELVQVLKKGNGEIADFTKELINVKGAIEEDEEEMETLTVMVEKMVNSIKSTFGTLGEGINSIVKVIVNSVGNFVETLSLLKPVLDGIGVAIKIIISPLNLLAEAYREIIEHIKKFTDSEIESKEASEKAALAYENERIALENLRTTVKEMSDESRKARAEWLKGRISTVEDWIKELEQSIAENNKLIEKYDQMTDISLGIPENFGTEEYHEAGTKLLEAQKNAENLQSELLRAKDTLRSLSDEYSVYDKVIAETAEAEAKVVTDFVSSLGKISDNTKERLLRDQIAMLEQDKKNAIIRLQNEGATDQAILNEKESYNEQIKNANLDLIDYLNEKEKEDFINKVATAHKVTAEKAKAMVEDEKNYKLYYDIMSNIDAHYENERDKAKKGTLERVKALGEEEIVIATEYKKKLLQQEMDYNTKMMKNAVTVAENEEKTQEEIDNIKAEYTAKNEKLLEEYYGILKKEALQGIEDTEERARIELYWDNELAYAKIENIERIRKAFEKQKGEDYSWEIKLLQLDADAETNLKRKAKIQAQILEKQRDMALATADEADKDKIIEYYNRRIDNLLKDEAASEGEVVEKQKILIDNLKVQSSWSEKLMEQGKTRIEKQIENDVKEAEIAGKSAEEIASIREKGYRDLEKKELKLLKLQEDSAKERAKNPVELLQIEQWYENERIALAEETERKIAELRSGKKDTGDKAEGVNARLKAVEEISSMELQWEEKIQSQKISNLEYTKGVMLSIAKEEGWTNEQIYENQAWYIDEITRLKREQLQKERDDAITNAYAIMENALRTEGLTKEEKEKMEDDYNDAVIQMRKYYLEEDEKLQMQALQDKNSLRDKDLKEEESFWNKVVAYVSDSMSEIAGFISQTFGNNGIVSGMLDVFESVKDMASGAFAMLKDIGKSLYEGFKTFFPEANEALQGIMGKIGDEVRGFFSNMPDWLKDAGKQLAKAFSVIGGHLVNVAKATVKTITAVFQVMGGALELYKKAWEGFVKVLDFDPDEALIGLLEFEDKILTFFMFTLPQLPSYLASVVESIDVMFDTLFNTIDFDALFDSLADAFSKVLEKLPVLIQKALPSIMKALKSMIKAFVKILPDMIRVGDELIKALFLQLPKAVLSELPNLMNTIVNFLPEFFRNGSQLVLGIVRLLPTLMRNVIDAFIAILQDRETLSQLVTGIVRGITEMATVIINNIVPIVKALIPAFVEIVINLIKELPNMVGQIVSAIGSALWDFIKALFTGSSGSSSSSGGRRDFGAGNWSDGYQFGDVTKTVVGAVGDAIGSAWDWITGWFADGTQNAPRGLAVVGEAGPELVNFRGGEQVLNNRNTQKLLSDSGKGGNTFNVTFNNLEDTSAYTMMRQLKQYQREMAINSVL